MQNLNQIKSLLIITAMDIEEQGILGNAKFKEAVIDKTLNIKIKTIKTSKTKIHFANSGVGLVNAAITTFLVSKKIKSDAMLLLSVGGALNSKLNIGDIVLADKIIQHDSVCSLEGNKHLMAAGELFLSVPENQRIEPIFYTNQLLLTSIKEKLLKQNLSNAVYTGTLLSGSEFVGCINRKQELATIDNALVVDMEASAIAQIAKKLNIPFLAIKTVSDRLMPDSSISTDYKKFLESASKNASLVFSALCNLL